MFKYLNIPLRQSLEVLVFLARHFRQSFYVREIAKTLSISVGGTSTSLTSLREMDLVLCEKRGRTLLYRADISHPVVREVKILATLLELIPVISALKASASRVILFGSCAEGEDTDESDIDLFVESDEQGAVFRTISQYSDTVSRSISPIILTPEEALQLRFRDQPLYERIQRGNVLIGER